MIREVSHVCASFKSRCDEMLLKQIESANYN